MSDTTESTTTEETTPEGQEPDAQSTEESSNTEAENTSTDEGNEDTSTPEDELPQWARTELSKVRAEAANYRTKLRDAEQKLADAKTPEEVEAAIASIKEENAKLERQVVIANVARKYDLPDELAARLQGSTPEEIEKDAKALQKFAAPTSPESLGGGLTPDDEDDGELDPRKLARRTRRS